MAFHLPLQFASALFGLLFGNFADSSRWMYFGHHHWFTVFISSPWVSFFLSFLFSFIIVWVSLLHVHKIGRHLVLGTGNGAKTSCTLLVIRFYYAGQVLDGWALGHGMRCCCALSRMNCMRRARVLCVYWCFRTTGIFISSLNWYIC